MSRPISTKAEIARARDPPLPHPGIQAREQLALNDPLGASHRTLSVGSQVTAEHHLGEGPLGSRPRRAFRLRTSVGAEVGPHPLRRDVEIVEDPVFGKLLRLAELPLSRVGGHPGCHQARHRHARGPCALIVSSFASIASTDEVGAASA